MKAIVFQGVEDVRVETVPDPAVADPRAAVVRITRSTICGSDLHLVHGAVEGFPGTVIGHECVGVVEDAGREVRRFRKGDRVIVPGVIGCGDCDRCRRGYAVGCLQFGNKVFGFSPVLPGGQAEAIAVPNADANLYSTPSELNDEQVLFLTDILPTGYYAAENAEIKPGDTVVVIGCGPVGLFAVMCARLFGPSQVLAVDRVGYRLEKARALGATPVDAGRQDVRAAVLEATDGRGAHAVIEAVGVAETVHLAFELVHTGGIVSVVGFLAKDDFPFPLGTAFMKDLTFRVGLVNVSQFIPSLVSLIRSERVDPTGLITHHLPLGAGERAYALFGGRQDGCLKVVLTP